MTERTVIVMALVLTAAAMMLGCSEASQSKVDEAKNSSRAAANNMQNAANSLAQAQKTEANVVAQQAAKDWNSFKDDMNQQLARNEAEIKELRQKIAAADAKERTRLNGELDKLQARNSELKKKIEAENNEIKKKVGAEIEQDKQRQAAFQREFQHDADELGKAFRNFWTDNVK
ncbi:MAG: hypothetical protein AB7V18_00050 [Pyrinomonadaceae bacterium]